MASRHYEDERREIDWAKIPFPDVKIQPSTFREYGQLPDAIAFAICDFAAQHRALVDSDAIAALKTLAESYQTLAKGVVYEKPIDYSLQRELYASLKESIAAYRKENAARSGVYSLPEAIARDALIFFTQLGATRTDGRPKGRAFLDFLRTRFNWRGPAHPSSLLIVP